MAKFWMILQEGSTHPNNTIFEKKEDAIKRADQMTKPYKENYIILEAIGIVKPVETPNDYTEF